MCRSFKRGQTSVVLRVKLLSSVTGNGLTGLSSASAGLIVGTIASNEASAVAYTQAGSTIEAVAVLGTYSAPTATKCRFLEIDSTNNPGLYELQLADARFAVASAKDLAITISGATNLKDYDETINLVDLDPYDSVRAGLTALPNAAAAASGGLLINGSNSGTVTLAALTVSGATTLTGAVSLGSTLGITGTTTLAALTTTGTATLNALTVSGATTLTGNVALAAGLTVTQSTGNASAVSITGNGTGHGVAIISGNGVTGNGLNITANSTNGVGMNVAGVGTGTGLTVTGGATGAGVLFVGGGTSGHGLSVTTTSGNGFNIAPTAGHGINLAANGTSKHGLLATGGTAGTSDGIKGAAGSGGVDLRAAQADILGLTDGIETSYTPKGAFRLMLSALAAKLAISGSTVTIRDIGDTKARITATTDSTGQRTAITTDIT